MDEQNLTLNDENTEVNAEIATEKIMADGYEKRNDISRYKMREQAVLLVFESIFSDSDIDELVDNLIDSRDIFLSDYAVDITKAIDGKKDELDAIISSHLGKGWKISRISRFSLSVLRVAIYEMKYVEQVPVSVAINEAVELTKKYSYADAPFVNGLLGSVSGEL